MGLIATIVGVGGMGPLFLAKNCRLVPLGECTCCGQRCMLSLPLTGPSFLRKLGTEFQSNRFCWGNLLRRGGGDSSVAKELPTRPEGLVDSGLDGVFPDRTSPIFSIPLP